LKTSRHRKTRLERRIEKARQAGEPLDPYERFHACEPLLSQPPGRPPIYPPCSFIRRPLYHRPQADRYLIEEFAAAMLLRKFPDVPPHSICRWVFGAEPREGAHGGPKGAPPKAVYRRLQRHGYTSREWRRVRHFDDMPEPPDGVAEAIATAIK